MVRYLASVCIINFTKTSIKVLSNFSKGKIIQKPDFKSSKVSFLETWPHALRTNMLKKLQQPHYGMQNYRWISLNLRWCQYCMGDFTKETCIIEKHYFRPKKSISFRYIWYFYKAAKEHSIVTSVVGSEDGFSLFFSTFFSFLRFYLLHLGY